jgi:tetratricopeptide (TPR) repeat protein
MRFCAIIMCAMVVSLAQMPSKQALAASRESAAAPELTQTFPFLSDGNGLPPGATAPEMRSDEPVFGPEGPRAPAQRKAETAQPKPQKNSRPGRTKPDDKAGTAKAEALKKAMAPHPPHAALRGQMLDVLFKRLASAADPDEARAVAEVIGKIWAQSDSDTAELLMQRAGAAMAARQYPLALELFDKVIALQPTWAEAWNKRATVRFLADDLDGAMADIKQVLKLEPRHFGALAGAGIIFRKEGLDKGALAAFRKALEINPQQPELRSLVDKLEIDVEGRGI